MASSNTFYCLVTSEADAIKLDSFRLLKEACKRLNIGFQLLTPPYNAYGFDQVPTLAEGGLYRQSIGSPRLVQYHYALRLKNPHLKSWFRSSESGIPSGGIPWRTVMKGEHNGLSILPTLHGLTSRVSDELLSDIDSKLGGFPVVIKKTGASHGAGVMLVDSPLGMKSILSHIIKPESADYVLRKYIPQAQHFRLIVLNDEVISTIEYKLPKDDFRTNTTNHPDVLPAKVASDVKQLAVAATQNVGVLFGGVDILVDKKGRAYIAEVNTPCNFARNQVCTGEDIAVSTAGANNRIILSVLLSGAALCGE